MAAEYASAILGAVQELAVTNWPVGTFARIDGALLGFEYAVLSMTTGVVGGPRISRELGFTRIAAHSEPFDIPVLGTLVGDARLDDQLAVHGVDVDGLPGAMVFVATFLESHPREWREKLHQQGEVVLLATSKSYVAYETTRDVLQAAWIARLPLAVFDFGGSVGTRIL